jgi:hypothetical protein
MTGTNDFYEQYFTNTELNATELEIVNCCKQTIFEGDGIV